MNRSIGYLVGMAVVLGVCGGSWAQTKATDPDPSDGAMDAVHSLLLWTPGSTAVFHDVYLGPDPNLGPDNLVQSHTPMALYWHIPGLVPGDTYYWRVDEIEADGTIHTGDVWTFTAQAMTAYYPTPADGSNVAPLAPDLTWLAGRDAVEHQVYFSDSKAAVADGTAEADKGIVEEPNYAPGELAPISTYYWRVDEIGREGTALTGDVWSFTTILPVEDFESYDDADNAIFQTWIDGWENGTGSTVGYLEAIDGTFGETAIVHGGAQSMPLDYNNVNSPYYSEAERTFAPAQDLTANEVDMLTLYVQGRAADFRVPKVATPPVLDGVVEEIWETASVQDISIAIDGQLDSPEDSSGSFRALYDSEYLYALVNVNDEALVQDSDPTQGWLDDRIEVFVDGDNGKDDAPDTENDYQYCFRWNHGLVETPVEWYRSPDSLAGVEYAVITTESGYLFEIKLPWSTMIGGPPQAGQLVGIDVMIGDDDDGGDRDSQIAWHLPAGSPHIPSMWGTALLAEEAADGADVLYVALQDTSNRTGVVTHPDPEIVKAINWVEWKVPLTDFADLGVNVAAVKKMSIGVGDRDNPVPGGAGLLFIDDIYLTKPAPAGQ